MVSWPFYTRLGQISRVLKGIEKSKMSEILAYVRIRIRTDYNIWKMLIYGKRRNGSS